MSKNKNKLTVFVHLDSHSPTSSFILIYSSKYNFLYQYYVSVTCTYDLRLILDEHFPWNWQEATKCDFLELKLHDRAFLMLLTDFSETDSPYVNIPTRRRHQYYVLVKEWFPTHVGFWGYMFDYTCTTKIFFSIQVISYVKISNKIELKSTSKCLSHMILD